LIITVVLLLTGCKKHNESGCVETNHGTTSLTPQELLIQPYGVHDSLVFFNESLNSTISYCCTNQSVSYQTLSENQPDSQGHIACLGNYFKKEVSATQFYISTKKFIVFFEYAPDLLDTLYKENGLQIESVFRAIQYPFDGFYAFRQDTLFTYPHWPAARLISFMTPLLYQIRYITMFICWKEHIYPLDRKELLKFFIRYLMVY